MGGSAILFINSFHKTRFCNLHFSRSIMFFLIAFSELQSTSYTSMIFSHYHSQAVYDRRGTHVIFSGTGAVIRNC